MKNTRIFILSLIALMMIGTASATVSLNANGRIEISGSTEQNINLTYLDTHPTVGGYVHNLGGGVWQLDRPLWIRNSASIDFTGDGVTELRVNKGTSTKTWDGEITTQARFPNGMTLISWNSTTNQYEPWNVDSGMGGVHSVNNLTIRGMGKMRWYNTPSDARYENLNVTSGIYTNVPFTIAGSNAVTSTPDKYASNVTLINPITDSLGLKITAIDGLHISGLGYIYDSSIVSVSPACALYLDTCHNYTIRDSVIAASVSGIELRGSSNGYIENVHITGNYNGLVESNGNGILTRSDGRISGQKCNNVTVRNSGIYDMGYGGIAPKAGDYFYAYDCVVQNGGHNGVDVRADYVYMDNVSSSGYNLANGQPWAVAATSHSTFKNIVIDGKGFIFASGENNTLENVVIRNARSTSGGTIDRIFGVNNQHNSTIINMVLESKTHTIQDVMELYLLSSEYPLLFPEYQGVSDLTLIDVDLSLAQSTGADIRIFNAKDTRLINANVTLTYDGSAPYSSTSVYWYPNIRVLNTAGQPVEGASITVNTTARNGYGNVQTTYYTDSNGRLYNSGNRTNWLAIPDYDRDKSGVTQSYISTITATKDGHTDSVSNVDPDSTWYSNDTSNLQSPLVSFVLDVAGEEEPVTPPVEPSTPTTWQNMYGGVADTFNSFVAILTSVYIISGLYMAYGTQTGKFRVPDTAFKLYMISGLALFVLIALGWLMLSMMDNAISPLLGA